MPEFIIGDYDTKNQKILALDYDHTIVKPKQDHVNEKNITLKNGREFPVDKNDWMWLRPNVPTIVKKYYNDGYNIVIITNQSKLWKIDMIKESLITLEIPIKVVVGFGKVTKDPSVIRKPNPALFKDTFDKETSLFVGDAAGRPADFSDSDKIFAKNIGMKFCIPEDIFPITLEKQKDESVYIKSEQEIVILVGQPASGKSTWCFEKLYVPSIPTENRYDIISGDELKTLPKMLKAAKISLELGNSVVFDATNPKKENREKIMELAVKYKITVRCIVFQITIDDAMTWNAKRMNETGKKVPRIAFYTFRKAYEKPTMSDHSAISDIIYIYA